jgi:hypothetical protein
MKRTAYQHEMVALGRLLRNKVIEPDRYRLMKGALQLIGNKAKAGDVWRMYLELTRNDTNTATE